MKFDMYVKHTGEDDSEAWKESEDRRLKPFPETETGALHWAEDCIKRFNDSLRPGEEPRTLVAVKFVDDGTSKHDWYKTSLVTEVGRGGMHDKMRCTVCGVTGKRFGLNDFVQRDPKFKAKKHEKCGGVPL